MAEVVPSSDAICEIAGRYMSIANGLMVLSVPRIRMIRRFRALQWTQNVLAGDGSISIMADMS